MPLVCKQIMLEFINENLNSAPSIIELKFQKNPSNKTQVIVEKNPLCLQMESEDTIIPQRSNKTGSVNQCCFF